MDVELKKGLLEAAVLSLLIKEDSYGYKVVKDIKPYIKVSESTLYPILRRLESNGMLSVYTVEHNSRIRKYYKITDKGINKRLKFIEEWEKVIELYNFIIKEGIGKDE